MINVNTEELFLLLGFIIMVAVIFGVAAFVAEVLERWDR